MRVQGTWDGNQYDGIMAPFHERYPKIKIDDARARARRFERSSKPLIAIKGVRYVADVLFSIGRTLFEYKKINVLEDLLPLPA